VMQTVGTTCRVSSLEKEAASIPTMEADDLANLASRRAQLHLLKPAVQQAEQRVAQSTEAFQHVAEQYAETHNHSMQVHIQLGWIPTNVKF
jgi:hypothetical protein